MTKMAAMPIYGKKKLQNLLQNQQADCHETWYVTLGTPANHSLFKWPWSDLDLFFGRVKFCNLCFSVGKSIKVDFSDTIAVCDLKLIELMKICEYWRSRSFLELGPRSFTYETWTCFISNHWAIFSQFVVSVRRSFIFLCVFGKGCVISL